LADISESEGTPESDYRRVRALDPVPLRRAATSLTGLHLSVANKFKETLDLAAIQRSSASVLPVSRGEPIPLRGLFQKIIRKTAVIERQPNEEVEYQYWHRIAAE
jgi:hypothetical protein